MIGDSLAELRFAAKELRTARGDVHSSMDSMLFEASVQKLQASVDDFVAGGIGISLGEDACRLLSLCLARFALRNSGEMLATTLAQNALQGQGWTLVEADSDWTTRRPTALVRSSVDDIDMYANFQHTADLGSNLRVGSGDSGSEASPRG